jgi:hypothetical protein
MGFFSGRVTFDRFRVVGKQPRQFGPEHVETLARFAIDQVETASIEQPDVGFLAGGHLFDCSFDLEKNVFGDVLHCGMRIDMRQIPAAIRNAWLQIELQALAAENPSGRPTKEQRQQAKDAVAARCEEEARSGRYRRMQQFPLLWDARDGVLYFGASSPTAAEHCAALLARSFDLELEHLTAGKLAESWAAEAKRGEAFDDAGPAAFFADAPGGDVAWLNTQGGNRDFLGNEFLLWLWWRLETQSDTIALADGSEVTGMFARTLALECPLGESGKETITAESPVHLPEAALAIRSGKLPRKAGLILVRYGLQYELVLQSETFSVSGAKIQVDDEEAEGRALLEDRIEGVRGLSETLDLLYRVFCQKRIGKAWSQELDPMRRWLQAGSPASRKDAA